MLKLIVGEEGGVVQNAIIPVRWCVDKSTLEELKQRGVVNPHILIVIASRERGYESKLYYTETSRYLAPLEQLIEYVRFLKPGKNTIFATIVWEREKIGKKIDLWVRYSRKTEGRYLTDLIHYNGGFYPQDDSSSEVAETNVEVPTGLFAKEYPKWLKKWVNLWYETKPKDQCHFRRRIIPAFTIQPLLILPWLVIRSLLAFAIALILLLSGERKIGFKAIIHPWKRDFGDIWAFTEGSIFSKEWKDEKGKEHQIRFLLPLAPIYPVALLLILYGIGVLGLGKLLESWKPFDYYINSGIVVGFTVVYAGIWDLAIYLFVQLRILLKPLIKALKPAPLPEPKPLSRPEPPVISYDSEQFLLCDGNLSTNIKDLPPKRRTVYLKFHDLKAKICKPLPQ